MYELRGGIERYMKTFPEGGYWKGKNYLFDRRQEQVPEAKSEPALEADVEALRARCDDLDYLVARAVVAKSRGEAVSPFPGGAEDSLLARFRALEEE